MPPATTWPTPAKSFGVDERRSLSGPRNRGAPAHRARELRIAPLGRLSSDVRVSIHEQAAGERRGEGEPELDRRQASSHPQPLCGIDRLAHRSPPVDCRPYDFWWAMTPTISGAATGSGQGAPSFAVKCPLQSSEPTLHLTAKAQGARHWGSFGATRADLGAPGLAIEARRAETSGKGPAPARQGTGGQPPRGPRESATAVTAGGPTAVGNPGSPSAPSLW